MAVKKQLPEPYQNQLYTLIAKSIIIYGVVAMILGTYNVLF